MKILVVDDEQLLVKGMKFNLENEGYTVETAYDGATAIDMAKSGGLIPGRRPCFCWRGNGRISSFWI